ncbi:MAG: hypothetical protein CME67_03825 [Halobacteriovoraceae bacterium]|mgnify:CR=1 FL=1|nr:hypothetical protein [Peredibacter sp.]MBJ00338.1 hypothetical protein [Halobacteriovoraceae bacterium]|tara:strand:+ start:8677 stop:9111 length:435 start_codon:yes stop_codon:yes gene_type:complete
MGNFFRILLSLSLLFSLNFNAFAQNQGDVDELVSESKNDLLVVVGGGLAGAILGLSTLSFVDEPKDHTKNILVGASLGIIAGVGYVAFSQANKSRDMLYGEPEASYEAESNFGSYARVEWHNENIVESRKSELTPFGITYSFRY